MTWSSCMHSVQGNVLNTSSYYSNQMSECNKNAIAILDTMALYVNYVYYLGATIQTRCQNSSVGMQYIVNRIILISISRK